MTQTTVVVAFARLPVPGKAKTRLAAGVGPVAAAEFYKLCAECTFHEIARCPHANATIYCSVPDDIPGMHQWLQQTGVSMSVYSQQQVPDLGQRMIAALTAAATGQEADAQQQQQWKELQKLHSNGYHHHRHHQQQQQTIDPGQQETTAFTAAAAAWPQSLQSRQQQEQEQEQQQQQQTTDLGHQTAADLTAARRVTTAESPARQWHQQRPAAQQDRWQTAQPHHHHQQQHQQQQQQYTAAIVVGTDIPDLSSTVMSQAAAALQQYDLVLGPAVDGGFYLMGLRTEALLKPEVQLGTIFDGVEWSTDSVLQRTVQGATAAGLRVAPYDMLPVLQDIDETGDLKAWVEDCGTKQQVQQQQQTVENGGQQQQHVEEPVQPVQQQQQQQLVLQACPRGKLLEYCQSLLST